MTKDTGRMWCDVMDEKIRKKTEQSAAKSAEYRTPFEVFFGLDAFSAEEWAYQRRESQKNLHTAFFNIFLIRIK